MQQDIKKYCIWPIVIISVLPLILHTLGVDFSSLGQTVDWGSLANLSYVERVTILHNALEGSFVHSIFEWSSFCFATVALVLAFCHYATHPKNVAVPVIGLSIFFAGSMDAFHALAANRLIEVATYNKDLIPFTWVICRTFSAIILVLGVGYLSFNLGGPHQNKHQAIIFHAFLFGILAALLIYYSANSAVLPKTSFPNSFITRPYDLVPLAIYACCACWLLPRLYKQNPSYFTFLLMVSMVPNIATQLYMIFGSKMLYDNYFNASHALKVFAYLLPMLGLVFDYIQMYFDNKKEIASRISFAEQQRFIIQQLNKISEKLKFQATHDPLTNLPNRELFNDRLNQCIATGLRNKFKFALLYIDLNGFKKINDNFGHQGGDQLLIEAAQRLKQSVRGVDTVARLGGDEFVIIVNDCKNISDLKSFAQKIIDRVIAPYQYEQRYLIIGLSVGLALFPKHGTDATSLIHCADVAMYEAKQLGKNKMYLYHEEIERKPVYSAVEPEPV